MWVQQSKVMVQSKTSLMVTLFREQLSGLTEEQTVITVTHLSLYSNHLDSVWYKVKSQYMFIETRGRLSKRSTSYEGKMAYFS